MYILYIYMYVLNICCYLNRTSQKATFKCMVWSSMVWAWRCTINDIRIFIPCPRALIVTSPHRHGDKTKESLTH